MNSPRHIEFLKDFPTLRDWLNINGFSMVYSIENAEMNVVVSAWIDRCPSEEAPGPQESGNFLMIVFCRECKVVEVYARGFLGAKGDDAGIAESMKSFVKNTVSEKIEYALQSEKLSVGLN